MKKILLTALALSPTVNAQVIECPKLLPSMEMPQSAAPSPHKAGARLRPIGLTYADIQVSELYGLPAEVPPPGKKVKGGWDTEYRFMPQEKTKWLLCVYGGTEWSGLKHTNLGAVEWWGKVDEKANSCVLKVRETKNPHSLSDWSATAVCK